MVDYTIVLYKKPKHAMDRFLAGALGRYRNLFEVELCIKKDGAIRLSSR